MLRCFFFFFFFFKFIIIIIIFQVYFRSGNIYIYFLILLS
jgi:hypothetical protein